MFEWRSKKDLDEYLLRYFGNCEIIGFVTPKTLKKWNVIPDRRGLYPMKNFYIIHKGNKYYYADKYEYNNFNVYI